MLTFAAVATVLHETESRIFQFLPIWKLNVTAGAKRFNESKAILLKEVESMIKSRRANGVSPDDNDLLGRLLAAEDPETRGQLIACCLGDRVPLKTDTGGVLTFTILVLCRHVRTLTWSAWAQPGAGNKLDEPHGQDEHGQVSNVHGEKHGC